MQTIAVTRYDLAVARGAALLDIEHPGWDSKIDLTTLDIRHLDNCILGQLYKNPEQPILSGYTNGVIELELDVDNDEDAEYGFALDSTEDTWTAYRLLTEAWLDLITERRKNG